MKICKGEWLTANHCSSFKYVIGLHMRIALVTLEGKKEQYVANPLKRTSDHNLGPLSCNHNVVKMILQNHFKTLHACPFSQRGAHDLPDYWLDLWLSWRLSRERGKRKSFLWKVFILSISLVLLPRKLLLEQAFLHSHGWANDTIGLSVPQFLFLASCQV